MDCIIYFRFVLTRNSGCQGKVHGRGAKAAEAKPPEPYPSISDMWNLSTPWRAWGERELKGDSSTDRLMNILSPKDEVVADAYL